MSIDTLIIDFTKLNDSIASAAQKDDEALLRSLDSDIQELFRQILAYVPTTKEQRVAQCNFLLGHLSPLSTREGTSQHICDKIVQLVSET